MRLAVTSNVNHVRVPKGKFKGEEVLIAWIGPTVIPTDMLFKFKRIHFPIRLTFAMTTNKWQGQSLSVCSLNLQNLCLSSIIGPKIEPTATHPIDISTQSINSHRQFTTVLQYNNWQSVSDWLQQCRMLWKHFYFDILFFVYFNSFWVHSWWIKFI